MGMIRTFFRKCSILSFCIFNMLVYNSCNFSNGNEGDSTLDTFVNISVNNFDTSTTETMRYIAGLPSEKFFKLQQPDYYKVYAKQIEKSWDKINTKVIEPVNSWSNENNIENLNDTTPLFYPFSGPDFLYAHTFFPKAKTYIMFGLEEPGNLPEIKELDSAALEAYHHAILISMRNIHLFSFFSTKKMKKNFKNKQLDGALHLILFYLGKTNHNIISYSKVFLDSFGEVKEQTSGETDCAKIDGLKIEFKNNESEDKQTLYYFRVDVTDKYLKKNIEFLYFINGAGVKNTFIKSASYLLHLSYFELIRRNILTQSKIILQDDSGIPYKILKKQSFDINLYGNYSRPVSLFSKRLQPDLEEAISNSNSRSLPFRFGYNSLHKEGIIILARRKLSIDNIGEKKKIKQGYENIVYKVQLKISKKKIKNYKTIFADFPQVNYYFHNGCYKYTFGEKKDRADCEELVNFAKSRGFKDAFIITFDNGKRVPIRDTREI
jgi:hypothetical protein